MTKKIKKIGFDLDGVIVDKPFFIPKNLLEWIVRDHSKKTLSYRYPESEYEIKLRQISQNPALRPPIKQQVELIKKLHKSKQFQMYVITSRYSFLKRRTKEWFDYYQMNGIFEKIYINNKNQQPHTFKEETIKKLKIELFIDDDLPLINYLKKRNKDVEFIFIENSFDYLQSLLKK